MALYETFVLRTSLSAGKGSKSSVHEIYAPFVVSSKVYCVFIMEYSHASCQR